MKAINSIITVALGVIVMGAIMSCEKTPTTPVVEETTINVREIVGTFTNSYQTIGDGTNDYVVIPLRDATESRYILLSQDGKSKVYYLHTKFEAEKILKEHGTPVVGLHEGQLAWIAGNAVLKSGQEEPTIEASLPATASQNGISVEVMTTQAKVDFGDKKYVVNIEEPIQYVNIETTSAYQFDATDIIIYDDVFDGEPGFIQASLNAEDENVVFVIRYDVSKKELVRFYTETLMQKEKALEVLREVNNNYITQGFELFSEELIPWSYNQQICWKSVDATGNDLFIKKNGDASFVAQGLLFKEIICKAQFVNESTIQIIVDDVYYTFTIKK